MDKKTLEFVTYCIVKLSAILNLSHRTYSIRKTYEIEKFFE